MKRVIRMAADIAIVGVPVVFRDGVGVAGAGCIAYGAWLIYEPAGYIVAGLLMLAFAWIAGKKAA